MNVKGHPTPHNWLQHDSRSGGDPLPVKPVGELYSYSFQYGHIVSSCLLEILIASADYTREMNCSREWMSPLPFGDAKGEKWNTIALPTVREEDILLNLTCLDSLNTLWQEKEEMEKIAPLLSCSRSREIGGDCY